jgi:hypothetical protein
VPSLGSRVSAPRGSKFSTFTKKPPTPQKILDGIVSETVRLVFANKEGFVSCVTCGIVKHWKYMDCGHWQSRRFIPTRYYLPNLGPQCEECNRLKDGENMLFEQFIADLYTPSTPTRIKVLSKTSARYFDYPAEIKKWREILEWVKNNPCTPLKTKLLKVIMDWEWL